MLSRLILQYSKALKATGTIVDPFIILQLLSTNVPLSRRITTKRRISIYLYVLSFHNNKKYIELLRLPVWEKPCDGSGLHIQGIRFFQWPMALCLKTVSGSHLTFASSILSIVDEAHKSEQKKNPQCQWQYNCRPLSQSQLERETRRNRLQLLLTNVPSSRCVTTKRRISIYQYENEKQIKKSIHSIYSRLSVREKLSTTL